MHVHRRVDVVEVPLVRRQRAVRVQEPLAEQHDELVLRERGIEVGPGDRVEPDVPGGEPRVLPRVRHREHVERVEVAPVAVAAVPVRLGRRRLARVAVEPAAHVVRVHLLAPDEPGARLAQDPHRLRRGAGRRERARRTRPRRPRGRATTSSNASPDQSRTSRVAARPVQPQPQLGLAAGRHRHPVAERRLRAEPVRVDRGGSGDDVVVDPVLRVRRRRRPTRRCAARSSRSRRRAPREASPSGPGAPSSR